MTYPHIDDLLKTAHALADAARAPILRHFRSAELSADNKRPGGFDPVTAADREAETAMRAVLAEMRPDDAILGEEAGASAGTSGLTWVLDPIDGTRAFLCGAPVFGVLIAVHDGARPLLGVIDQPFTGERFTGAPGIAELTRGTEKRALSVRRGRGLENAILLTTFPEVGTERDAAGFAAVRDRVLLTRYGLDCYGYALLALGQVDLVIEAGLQSYDIQAPITVVEAAGGVVTDWRGGPADQGGQAIAAGDPALHRAALDLLAPFAA
ncbi:histidinol-phosphatase [Pikeienuella piscinae]|uniref:histidinol-phosphatase n=1 Tax=Pikeienuella piscinae TaxID=2748098 RepID=UPI001FE3E98B|nr:histidinol-phosphatase [Pikeienuella piscinae]